MKVEVVREKAVRPPIQEVIVKMSEEEARHIVSALTQWFLAEGSPLQKLKINISAALRGEKG
jgi:hypothetical protein